MTRRRWRKPTSASPCRPALRPRARPATWSISIPIPTKLIEVVEIGKQLLMTRGALTTFSIANDVAKYFAIIPAIFLAFYPQLAVLNVMHLATPQSAILSAIIFNALIIIALIPLALEGCRLSCRSAPARCCGATCWSTGWAASCCRSSASRRSTLLVNALHLV